MDFIAGWICPKCWRRCCLPSPFSGMALCVVCPWEPGIPDPDFWEMTCPIAAGEGENKQNVGPK